MEARAVRKYIRSSPRKMRRVINVVRGETVADAVHALTFMPQAVTTTVVKTIQSAVHNLIDQNPDERLDEERLIIQEIRVDEGPRFKRFRPSSRGRAQPYQKRLCHLTVVVAMPEMEEV